MRTINIYLILSVLFPEYATIADLMNMQIITTTNNNLV